MISSLPPQELLALVPELAEVISLVTDRHGYKSDSEVWMNLYRNGNDYTLFHTDNYGKEVATVSIGQSRKFSVRGVGSFQIDN